MDFSALSTTTTALLSAVAGSIGTVVLTGHKILDLRQKLATVNRELQQAKDDAQARWAVEVRAARESAGRLEAFAHACHALSIENERAFRAGDAISFDLPALAPGLKTGDSAAALELESAYRDLQQLVESVNQHIDETYRDNYYVGPTEALGLLDTRAYETAALALQLAGRYRKHFKVPRTPLGGREQRIEQEILARAAEEDAA
ncbi:hypothetical protein [Burkholderia pseudomultivorans]|uniref:hypothetical protein n=1 Tax=Burkholderia pseudomultivorans TaxID=1207504 RepID=UPI0012D9F682|nr:hypothetical protein [Burkholderia pseudomultivorans]